MGTKIYRGMGGGFESIDEGASESQEASRSLVTIVWDPAALSEDDYADLVVAFGNLIREQGGLGVARLRSKGFGVPCEVEVTP